METHHGHLDEISVWTWVATLAFILIALTAVLIDTHDNLRVAKDVTGPALPLVQPALLPPSPADPHA